MKTWKKMGWAAAAALAVAPMAQAADDNASAPKDRSERSSDNNYSGDKNRSERSAVDGTAGTRDTGSTGSGQTTNLGGTKDQNKQPSKHDNTDVIKKLHAANVAEIEMAKAANDNAQSENVKQFADTMVKDHTQMRDALEKVASNRNLKFDKDQELAPFKGHISSMKNMKGAQFDQHFTQMMVSEHQKDLSDVQNALQQARSSGDTELAQVLENAQTKIQEHHRMAQSLDQKKGSDTRMGRRASDSATSPSSTSGAAGSSSSSTGSSSQGSSTTADPHNQQQHDAAQGGTTR
jgi:putative membrane protein